MELTGDEIKQMSTLINKRNNIQTNGVRYGRPYSHLTEEMQTVSDMFHHPDQSSIINDLDYTEVLTEWQNLYDFSYYLPYCVGLTSPRGYRNEIILDLNKYKQQIITDRRALPYQGTGHSTNALYDIISDQLKWTTETTDCHAVCRKKNKPKEKFMSSL